MEQRTRGLQAREWCRATELRAGVRVQVQEGSKRSTVGTAAATQRQCFLRRDGRRDEPKRATNDGGEMTLRPALGAVDAVDAVDAVNLVGWRGINNSS